MGAEPPGSQFGHPLQGAVLFEQVRGSRDNGEPLFADQVLQGFFVEPDHLIIGTSHDEQRRRGHRSQRDRAGQVGAPTA